MKIRSPLSIGLIISLLLLVTNKVNARAPNSPLLNNYDYIIVGGGPGGLTVATRLSEYSDVTVLLLEAGPIDQDEAWVRIPFFAGQGVGSNYDWNLMTVPQTSLDGQARAIPQGRALGGGTIINALLWNRGGASDYDDCASLGNPGWGWSDMLPYFVKSETFTPYPSPETAQLDGIGYDPSFHGSTGPVNVSFSNFIYNQSRNVFAALNELGIPTSFDPNDGSTAGASFLPESLDPSSQVRADARRSHNATIYARPNLDIWTGQHVTRILFDMGAASSNTTTPVPGDTSVGQGNATNPDGTLFGVRNTTAVMLEVEADENAALSRRSSLAARLLRKVGQWTARKMRRWSIFRVRRSAEQPPTSTENKLRAIGVEFAAGASSQRQNITANREVIVSAGAVHTPQLLKLSGIGPVAELSSHSIPVLANIPGVGTNLQDHILVGVYYPYANSSYLTSIQIRNNATLMMEAQEEYRLHTMGPWTAGPPDGDAFPSLPQIVDDTDTIISSAQAQNVNQFLPGDLDPTVIAGYAAQHSLLVGALQSMTRAAYELLNFNYGAFSNANMRPFSRGTVTLNSSQPFDPPLVDPRYGSNPIDLEILLAALLFNRRILRTDVMQILQPQEIMPAANATETQLMDMIRRNVATEYHVSCSCPMLPLSMGGVVDSNLVVYGTHNLRIVDSSIMPMVPSAHLQAVVYGLSEKAADIIKAAHNLSLNSSSSPLSTATYSTAASNSTWSAPSGFTISFTPSSVALSTDSHTTGADPVVTVTVTAMVTEYV